MAIYKRQEVATLLKGVEQGKTVPVYLLFGERYLCQEIANDLVCRLLPDEAQRVNSLKAIDGDQEEMGATVNMFKTYSLFGTRQVIRVMDSQILYSKVVASGLWDKARKAWGGKETKKSLRYLAQMLALADLTPGDWEKEEMVACAPGRWQELFGFAKPDELAWVAEVCTASEGSSPTAAPKVDGAELLMAALEAGVPSGNILILVAEAADKRKKLFKYLEKNCAVVDLSVDTGSSSAARKDQDGLLKDIVQQSLARFGKRLEPRALPVLLERVGFHPVAVAMEAEKLALSVGEVETITMDDLNAMVGRTREEALYELNEAFGNHDLGASLTICRRLQENGVHPLIVVAGLRNFLRKLLLVRAIIEQPAPAYPEGISYAAFQKGLLPQLQESLGPQQKALGGHPFAVYKSFQQAERFTLAALKQAQTDLLAAEYRLKGSGLPEYLILEDFLFSVLQVRERARQSSMAG
ncbi:DNA polymerase III subunit delta [Thiovibrio frasassiensis]|uniref:DNA-directed DNA polymerase n=1 Tax=Thiovibrio frasassiensis TaxID=2984131 RepID=A0A9X4MG89_9BACT|nr:DNA polymerase III subunit delta [Thiovibrio frasassiensis]MDG4475315.1 DNA polymerase III subunit delta [Thiovibrio frasassiensis]